ncbi:hypothetical protein ES703_02978 [subsurface metagenome]
MKEKVLEKILRREMAQKFRDHYLKIIEDLRAAHGKLEKGLISKKTFERYEKSCDHLLEVVEAAEYKILHGPGREFSKLIRIRKGKGLTQAEAAEKAGMSLAWYALLEQGFKEKISKKQKEKVAKMLDVPYEELFPTAYWAGEKIPEKIKKQFGIKERPVTEVPKEEKIYGEQFQVFFDAICKKVGTIERESILFNDDYLHGFQEILYMARKLGIELPDLKYKK